MHFHNATQPLQRDVLDGSAMRMVAQSGIVACVICNSTTSIDDARTKLHTMMYFLHLHSLMAGATRHTPFVPPKTDAHRFLYRFYNLKRFFTITASKRTRKHYLYKSQNDGYFRS